MDDPVLNAELVEVQEVVVAELAVVEEWAHSRMPKPRECKGDSRRQLVSCKVSRRS